ncbi:hypothetical protein DPMN_089192 [Dreissena polymorpha]|uniref:Uncharacterized protein n=3 Tax=Dreissena polymorpha TaxID=45954 RepID=A0A9D4QYL4_DREPO|nr:hypothetical protein DPMN_089192 [Dreissena polymorpha]
MLECNAIQSTCVVFLVLINSGSTTENTLGYLSVRNLVFVGGNMTLMLIPFYHVNITNINYLKLQVIFRTDNAAKEIHGAIRPFKNGKAFFMEITNVNKTWNNSAVFFKYSNTESNNVAVTIKDRTEGLLHILSDPSQPEDSAQIAFYPPVGFQDWKQIHHWWSNRYGGNVNDANKEEIIVTIKIANHRTIFLEYFHKDSPMNISATVVSAHKGVGPPCTNQECGHCVCVHRGEDFTCSTDGRMLAMWIGSENVDFEQITDTRNEVKQYRPHNGSITKHHHNSTIVCFMEKNGFVFNASATLIVLDPLNHGTTMPQLTAIWIGIAVSTFMCILILSWFITIRRAFRTDENVTQQQELESNFYIHPVVDSTSSSGDSSAAYEHFEEKFNKQEWHHSDNAGIITTHDEGTTLQQFRPPEDLPESKDVDVTIEHHYDDIEEELGATADRTQPTMEHKFARKFRYCEDLRRTPAELIRLETSGYFSELNQKSTCAVIPLAYEDLKRHVIDPGHKYTAIRPRRTSSI